MKHSRWILVAKILLSAFLLMSGAYDLVAGGGSSYNTKALSVCILCVIPFLWVKYPILSVAGVYTGLFVFTQSMAGLIFLPPAEVTLSKNIRKKIDVQAGLLGITGIQTVSSDEKGYRVTKPIDYGKPSALRIFAVGASTTEQIFLDDRKTWTYLLEDRLSSALGKDVEVINTGVSGLRVSQHIDTMANIISYHPDIVIFLFGVNDWNRYIVDHYYLPHTWKRYLPDSVRLRRLLKKLFSSTQTPLGKGLRRIANLRFVDRESGKLPDPEVAVKAGTYYDALRPSLQRSDQREFFPEAVQSSYAEEVSLLMDFCRSSRIICIYSTQPSAYRVDVPEDFQNLFWMTPPKQEFTVTLTSLVHVSTLYNSFLKTAGSRKNVRVCDLAEDFPIDGLYDDIHFNEFGAREIAGKLFECVIEELRGLPPST